VAGAQFVDAHVYLDRRIELLRFPLPRLEPLHTTDVRECFGLSNASVR